MYVENKYLNLVDYANLFNNSIIRIGEVSADVGVEIGGLQEGICAFVLNYLLCNAIRQDEASRNGRRFQIAPYRFGCQPDLVVWGHFVRVLLEQGAVAFRHCRKDGLNDLVTDMWLTVYVAARDGLPVFAFDFARKYPGRLTFFCQDVSPRGPQSRIISIDFLCLHTRANLAAHEQFLCCELNLCCLKAFDCRKLRCIEVCFF